VEAHPHIKIFNNAQVEETIGHLGKFSTTIRVEDRQETVKHGATIISTGAREYQPSEYLCGENPKVLTQRDFQQLLAKKNGLPDKSINIVMIQCVGSRDEERPYCSRICCTQAITNALRAKKAYPSASVSILFLDIRTFGLNELLYKEARESGIQFIRFNPDQKPEVEAHEAGLRVTVFDQNLREEMTLSADYLVLSVAIVPELTAKAVATALKLPLDQDGFFLEAHIKLRPLDFANAGYFLCGLAHGPKFLEESIAQAKGAAARAATILSKKQMMVGGEVAIVDRENCVVCLTCMRTCPFSVPKVAEDGFISIEPAECRGCGSCVSACPRKVIQLQHMTDAQVIAKETAACG
jgi:heterodisulfide reductase subunit A-like polyferredoxin